MSVEALTASRSGKRAAMARGRKPQKRARRSSGRGQLPTVHQVFGAGTTFAQFLSLTRLRISNIMHELPFWAIAILMAVLALINGHFAGKIGGQRCLARHLPHGAGGRRQRDALLLIVATLYAAELIWRERDTHFSGIHDALPMCETTDWLSKLFAICFVELILLTVASAMRHHHADRRGLLPLRARSSTSRSCTSSPSRRC